MNDIKKRSTYIGINNVTNPTKGLCRLKYRHKRRFYRVLTIVYNTQNYRALGLRPSSGILVNTKHNVSETGSISVLR
jgi:hypothetical protein